MRCMQGTPRMCVYSIDIPYSIDIKSMYIYNVIQNYIRLYYYVISVVLTNQHVVKTST